MPDSTFAGLGLSVVGLGTQYPAHSLRAADVDALSKRFYTDSPAMAKVLSINRAAGIESRASIAPPDDPMYNQQNAPSIADLHKIFILEGVPLAISAAKKAIKESALELDRITHVVSATCTDSANPGFDHSVVKGLGITHRVEKVLLHGVGCSGGLAALRTAANLALGHTARGLPARVLCVALEVNTPMVRSELDSIQESQQVRIAACLFSDAATAVVLSNGIGEQAEPVYELLGWDHRIIPDTESELGFDVDPAGWKAILTPRVPQVTAAAMLPTFEDLLAALPPLPPTYSAATDFDWVLHPGGPAILANAERALSLTRQHLRASYDVVLDRLRCMDADTSSDNEGRREYIVACAFGPGVAVEMCILRRRAP
ncbi:hypothetical protein PCL_06872 [Purpureocillium lilacinum]|uniref:Chalcone synthase n=1 Tax=Purpureocillium lilacinum TaxID=33203 RepID=A0A2U3DTT9_PURLI|nr:hypothetical protein PCL_06872 [Purpureocillium lilacinum]